MDWMSMACTLILLVFGLGSLAVGGLGEEAFGTRWKPWVSLVAVELVIAIFCLHVYFRRLSVGFLILPKHASMLRSAMNPKDAERLALAFASLAHPVCLIVVSFFAPYVRLAIFILLSTLLQLLPIVSLRNRWLLAATTSKLSHIFFAILLWVLYSNSGNLEFDPLYRQLDSLYRPSTLPSNILRAREFQQSPGDFAARWRPLEIVRVGWGWP
jgi:arginine exporter protein ArgO